MNGADLPGETTSTGDTGQGGPNGTGGGGGSATRWIVAGVLAVLVVAGVVAVLSGGDDDRLDVANRGELVPVDEGERNQPPEGVTAVPVESQSHVEGDVEYATVPGAGGDHAPVWVNCGFYPTAQIEEQAVHSLEHGAVWIAYRPDLSGSELDQLVDVAAQPFTLVTPVEGLDAPVVATAWGARIEVGNADDPALAEFLTFFRQGPQTPEPGAPCTGGVGTPQ